MPVCQWRLRIGVGSFSQARTGQAQAALKVHTRTAVAAHTRQMASLEEQFIRRLTAHCNPKGLPKRLLPVPLSPFSGRHELPFRRPVNETWRPTKSAVCVAPELERERKSLALEWVAFSLPFSGQVPKTWPSHSHRRPPLATAEPICGKVRARQLCVCLGANSLACWLLLRLRLSSSSSAAPVMAHSHW